MESGTRRKAREAADPDIGRQCSELNLQRGEINKRPISEMTVTKQTSRTTAERERGREVTEKTNLL